ncbi:MAG: hypothetical protein JAZ06_04155 [Candidatus Thiodiazotropha taylori]|nr:hypothetical protein [Candidatus Thiodiazotropha taylori]
MSTVRGCVTGLSLILLAVLSAQVQAIDADLNLASRILKQVEQGLDRLRPGDVASYNRLSSKLNRAAKHLETTQSKSLPEYTNAVKHWGMLQARMVEIANNWNAQRQNAQAAQTPPASKSTSTNKSPAESKSAQVNKSPPANKPSPGKIQPAPAVEPVDLDPLMTKYQRSNLPKLPDNATAEQARTWARQMKGLQTTQLQNDLASIDSALKSGAASKSDADRVRRWVSDIFQGNIKQTIRQKVQINEGTVESMLYMADMINAVKPGDKNGAYRFAGDEKLQNNRMRLDDALRAGSVLVVFDELFGGGSTTRADKLKRIESARTKLDELAPLAAEQARYFARAPKKQPPVIKEFLAPIAQKYWLNGSVTAESESDGSIWIDAYDVADITHNGKIWIESNERGSIEPNGDVWFDGNQVGSLESNGEVWRSGNQVGLIEQNGTVWINGSPAGEIVPFQGEWKRAAILYYFREFFPR